MKRILALLTMVMFVVSMLAAVPALAEVGSGSALEGIAQPKGTNVKNSDDAAIKLSKLDMTLKKGKSATLKALSTLDGKALKAKWKSSNPKVAKVSSSGKVTAVSPGTAVITATYKDFYTDVDKKWRRLNECWVTVTGSSKDPKSIKAADRSFFYGKKKLTFPTLNKTIPAVRKDYKKTLTSFKKSIGGYYFSEYGNYWLNYGSKASDKAHTMIIAGCDKKDWLGDYEGYTLYARPKSSAKTSRGIAIGAKKSGVIKKYGQPTYTLTYKDGGKTYEEYYYMSRAVISGKVQYIEVGFQILKSKGTVENISVFCGYIGEEY